jgi:hypothetical protein
MRQLAFVLTGWLATALLAPTSGHYPLSGYNLDKLKTLNGTLIALRLANPRSLLSLEVAGPHGELQNWTVEWAPAALLMKQGVTVGSLAIGDRLAVTGFAARDTAAYRLLVRAIRRPADGWSWSGATT